MINDTTNKQQEKHETQPGLRINRFHIINPDADELFIRELRSTSHKWIIYCLVLACIGGFFIFITLNSYITEGVAWAFLFPGVLGIIPLVTAVAIAFSHFSDRSAWHFTPRHFIRTNSFGRKRIFQRSNVKSVFIHKVTFVSNRPSFTRSDPTIVYSIHLKMREGSELRLMQLDNGDVAKNPGFGLKFMGIFGADAEAEQIADLISEHWKIPISV